MKLTYRCPVCERLQQQIVDESRTAVACEEGDWSRDVTDSGREGEACLVCGCPDLWRQKDFPQRLGLLMVAVGAIASTIAWFFYYPKLAIGILMGFALVDLMLYTWMTDVLVCYRCKSRHKPRSMDDSHAWFDLEVAERYRQQDIRMKEAEAEAERKQPVEPS